MDLRLATSIDDLNPVAGDVYLNEQGTVELTQSLSDQVRQDLWIRLRFFLGEWFLDPTQGIPYFQNILGGKTPLPIVAQIYRKVILTTAGVASLDSFNLARTAERGVSLSFAVTLVDGAVLTFEDFQPLTLSEAA